MSTSKSLDLEHSYVTGVLKGNTLVISDIWVAEDQRRTGLGRKLVDRIKEVSGASRVLVYGVVSSAEPFWTKLGIESTMDLEEGK